MISAALKKLPYFNHAVPLCPRCVLLLERPSPGVSTPIWYHHHGWTAWHVHRSERWKNTFVLLYMRSSGYQLCTFMAVRWIPEFSIFSYHIKSSFNSSPTSCRERQFIYLNTSSLVFEFEGFEAGTFNFVLNNVWDPPRHTWSPFSFVVFVSGSRFKRLAVPLGLMSAGFSVCYPAKAVAVVKVTLFRVLISWREGSKILLLSK